MKTKMAYEEALRLAEEVVARLADGCMRIEIAGSLCRKKAEIGDIELVAIPKMAPMAGLFEAQAGERSLLDEVISANYAVIKGGPKYKQLALGFGLATCDLFIQPNPATWGTNFMIRTGSADFSKWIVTERQKGGALPGYMTVADARLWCGGEVVATPEEEDFFHAIGIRWIPPEERERAYWGESLKFAEKRR